MDKPLNIKYADEQESFGMSGPYLATCYLNDRKLKQKFLLDNHVVSADNKYLVLNRFTATIPKKIFGLFKFIDNKRDFRIVVCDLEADSFYVSKQSYNALYLQQLTNKTISFYKAFHDKLPEYEATTVIADTTFEKHKLSELFEE